MSEIKRTANMSPSQKTELIHFMEKNPQLRSGKFTKTFTFKKSQELWIKITNSLNSLPGAQKTWQQWRKTWHDLKVSAKRKTVEFKKYQRTTGGGPALPKENLLNNEEIQVVNMMDPVATEGHLVAESSTSFEFPEPFINEEEFANVSIDEDNEMILLGENEETASDHLYYATEKTDDGKENIKLPSKPKRSTKKLFQVQRLNQTIAATEKMAEQNKKRIDQKGLYEAKKLKLYEQDIEVKKRIATALEKIAQKM